MKIAMIAPPWIPIPPKMYGGIETVIYNLVIGLIEAGEDVILIGHSDSKVPCKLIPYIKHGENFGLASSEREKWLMGELGTKYAYAIAHYEGADVIHDHTLALSRVKLPTLHTLHGPSNELTVKRCVELSHDPKNNFVSISDRQRETYLKLNHNINFVGTVHNSVDAHKLEWTDKKEDFFLFVGRANWEKGLDLAVRVASKAGVGLVMAVKMTEKFEQEFFEKEIQPWIDKYPKNLALEFHQEIDRELLMDLYRRAKGTLFTSRWEEPFGLVMIESMACGTPVVSLRRGAAPEVIKDGETGFLVDTEEEMAEKVKQIDKLRPGDCRRHIEENFSIEKMTGNYIEMYKKSVENYRAGKNVHFVF